MSYTFSNESSAVIADISTQSSAFGTFNAPSTGSYPILNGDTIQGDNSALSDEFGSPYATLQVFILEGDAQADTIIDGELYSTTKLGSGISTIQIPEISNTGTTIFIEFSNI